MPSSHKEHFTCWLWQGEVKIEERSETTDGPEGVDLRQLEREQRNIRHRAITAGDEGSWREEGQDGGGRGEEEGTGLLGNLVCRSKVADNSS